MIKKQKYGVEVEMTGITRAKAASIIAEVFGTRASSADESCYRSINIKDQSSRIWKVMRDSSINPVRNDGTNEYMDEYRIEMVTPPLKYEDIEILQNIIRKLREAGAKANSSCGIHIHVDGANHTPKSLKKLINFMVDRQDLIYEALNIGARGDSWCKKLNPQLLVEMKKDKNLSKSSAENIWYSRANDNYSGGIDHQHYNTTRYHGVNLHSYFSKGTVEFRLFNSTLHAGKIKAYIQFCLAVSSWAITSNDNTVFRSIAGYSAEKKVTIMRNILTHRLGLFGDEFKTCRLWMMKNLKDTAGMTSRVA